MVHMKARFLFVIFISIWMSCLTSAAESDKKGSNSEQGLKVSLGDRTAQVRSVYGEPDEVTKDKSKETWNYYKKGLLFFFEKGALEHINIRPWYRGGIEGIHINDSQEVIRAKLGPPDDDSRDRVWEYYRGNGPKRVAISFQFGKDNKVKYIKLIRYFRKARLKGWMR